MGRFANRPMRVVDNAEIAAVEVIKSWRTSATQRLYSRLSRHPSPVGQTQVPPESARIAAFTEIWPEIQ